MAPAKDQPLAQLDSLGSEHAAGQHSNSSPVDSSAAGPAHSNVVPWRRQAPFQPQQYGHPAEADKRITLLFDLNGTLTSHTSKRRSAGINRMRPGLDNMQRLQVRLSC